MEVGKAGFFAGLTYNIPEKMVMEISAGQTLFSDDIKIYFQNGLFLHIVSKAFLVRHRFKGFSGQASN